MPSTTLIFLPAPNINPPPLSTTTTPSATSTIITHISRTHTPKPLGPYTLEHRLLVDTASLLPGHTAPRRYTHFLNLPSHFPGQTFVGTSSSSTESSRGNIAASTPSKPDAAPTNGTGATETPPPPGGYTLITIPSQPDSLFPLLMQKMSALWVPRQAHRIETNASFEIRDWKVRIGELKITGGQGQGRVRGCICEVEFLDADDGDGEDDEEMGGLAKAFFESLVDGAGVGLGGIKVVRGFVGEDDRLVRQYMDLLKFGRL